MDTATQNALAGGTATLELDKLFFLVEQRAKAIEEAKDGKAIAVHQLLECVLPLFVTMESLIPPGRFASSADPGMTRNPILAVVHRELLNKGYDFKYQVNPTTQEVKIIEITKIP